MGAFGQGAGGAGFGSTFGFGRGAYSGVGAFGQAQLQWEYDEVDPLLRVARRLADAYHVGTYDFRFRSVAYNRLDPKQQQSTSGWDASVTDDEKLEMMRLTPNKNLTPVPVVGFDGIKARLEGMQAMVDKLKEWANGAAEYADRLGSDLPGMQQLEHNWERIEELLAEKIIPLELNALSDREVSDRERKIGAVLKQLESSPWVRASPQTLRAEDPQLHPPSPAVVGTVTKRLREFGETIERLHNVALECVGALRTTLTAVEARLEVIDSDPARQLALQRSAQFDGFRHPLLRARRR